MFGDSISWIKETLSNILYSIKMCWLLSPSRAFLIIILKTIIGLFPIAIMLAWKEFLNNIADALSANKFYCFECMISILIYCFLVLIRDVLNRVSDYYFRWESDALTKHITKECLDKIKIMSAKDLDCAETFNLVSKAGEQSASHIYNILYSIFTLIESIITLVSTTILMVSFSVVPIALCVISTIPSFVISLKIVEEQYGIFNRRYEKQRFIGYLKNLIINSNNAKEMKLYGSIDYLKHRIDHNYDLFIKEDSNLRFKNAIKTSLAQCLDFIFLYGSKIYIILKGIEQHILIGSLTMNLSCIEQFVNSLSNLMGTLREMYDNNLYIENIRMLHKYGEAKAEKDISQIALTDKIDSFILQDVGFKYDDASKYILKDVSYKFVSGKKYCIVGENGSGKSTLIKLLSCLYDPEEGKILINGKDSQAYKKDDIYKHISVMFQNFIRYPLTIDENIRLGRKENNFRKKTISKVSGSSNFISNMRKGYNTKLQKEWTDGIDISGGEWQRLAIDRAIYNEREVYIFDEPTSAIDGKAELTFFEWIKEQKDKIIIYIVHKISLAQFADEILVLNNGYLVEKGNYDYLIKKRGFFFNMLINEQKEREYDFKK